MKNNVNDEVKAGRVIRNMTEDDLIEVEAIENATFSIPWSYNSLRGAMMMGNNIYLVCVEDGEIAGYCGMWAVLGEGNITSVAVAERFRNRGIGRALMEAMLEKGIKKNVDVFFLEVRQSNEAAKHLYESLGFKTIGVRKNFYEKPLENADVMSKIISRQ